MFKTHNNFAPLIKALNKLGTEELPQCDKELLQKPLQLIDDDEKLYAFP